MPDGIQLTCVACLSCELVAERHGVVCAVPHPGGLLAQGEVGCIQQARVGGADAVPAHPLAVERPHRVNEGLTGTAVVTAHREIEAIEEIKRAIAEWDDPESLFRLRWVDPPGPVAGAADVDEMAVYVAWLYGDDLTPAQPGEKDDLRDLAPDARQSLDHFLHLYEAQRVAPGPDFWDAWAFRRER